VLTSADSSGNLIAGGFTSYPWQLEQQFAMHRVSALVNTASGKTGKVFTLNRNGCSRAAGTGVHVEPEWVFMMGRNMQS
jgi:hypothetical protein